MQWDSLDDEAVGIAEFIHHKTTALNVPAGQCLVLAPSKIVGYRIRDAMRARQIPTLSFFREEPVEDPEAQEALTTLLLLADPDDRVALRSWLAFGSSTKRRGGYRRALTMARAADVDVAETLRKADAEQVGIPYGGELIERWRLLQQRLAELRPLGPRDVIDALFPDGVEAVDILRQLALSISEGGTTDLGSLAAELRASISQPEVPLESTEARVMSFHKSKGLTAQLVVLAGLVEGLMPFARRAKETGAQRDASLEEQRRLLYVGLTRTKQTVMLSTYVRLPADTAQRLGVAASGRWMGRGYTTQASRYLAELGPALPKPVPGTLWRYV